MFFKAISWERKIITCYYAYLKFYLWAKRCKPMPLSSTFSRPVKPADPHGVQQQLLSTSTVLQSVHKTSIFCRPCVAPYYRFYRFGIIQVPLSFIRQSIVTASIFCNRQLHFRQFCNCTVVSISRYAPVA